MTISDEPRHFFKLLQGAIRVTVDEDSKDFLNVLSNSVLVVKIRGGTQNAMQLLLGLVISHELLHNFTDLNVTWTNHRVLWDIGCLALLFLLLNLGLGPALAPFFSFFLLRHFDFCNVKSDYNQLN